MPKISAPTVAEHRTAQRAALLRSGEHLLVADGIDAVTPGRVASHAGLARSSFYEYFSSRDDLLLALAREAFEAWSREMSAAIAGIAPGEEQLRMYIATTLRFTADGRHDLATALRDVDFTPRSRDEMVALHDDLDAGLQGVLEAFSLPDTRLASAIVHGALGAGMRLVEHGVPVEAITGQVTDIVLRGVAG